MKKYTFLVLALFMLVSIFLAGCGNKESNIATENNEGQQEPATKEEQTSTTGNYYFTANEGGSISKIDIATNEVVDTITLEGAVHNVQVSPDGKVLGATLVPGMGHGNEANSDSTEHGDEHSGMTSEHNDQASEHADDHNDAHATDGHSMDMTGSAFFFDTKTNEVIKEVKVGNHPAHIVFTSDGKYALVTNNEDNNVSVIDVNTFTVTNTVETGKGPHGFRISADDKFAYIANMGEDTVRSFGSHQYFLINP